jgi:hypothetical protein
MNSRGTSLPELGNALFTLQIVGIDGKSYALEGCAETETVGVIKRRLESSGGVRMCQQQLYAGDSEVPLRNQMTLKAAGLSAEVENSLCLIIGNSSSWIVGEDEHEVEIFDEHDGSEVVRTDLEKRLYPRPAGDERQGQAGDDEYFRAFTLSNLLSPAEAATIVTEAEKIGFEDLSATFPDAYRRNNDRMLLFSEDTAEVLYSRLLPHLCREDSYDRIPIGFGQGGDWKPDRLNECLKISRYTEYGTLNTNLHSLPHLRQRVRW